MNRLTTSVLERIDTDPRSKGSARLIVDGRAALTVPLEAVRVEELTPGLALTEDLAARLAGWADQDAAFRTALRSLERRPFARRDLSRRLRLKGHQPSAVDAALDRAERLGYLDDERFARHYVQSRSTRGRGPARIRRELGAQGVAPAIADRILAEEVSNEDSTVRIVELARKRAGQLASLERPDRFRRVVAYLARRGYTGAEVRRAVREAL